MREHQININIKAQQFEQLQKLAREHGFKSVTSYLKIKMLDLLLSPGELSAISHTQPPLQNAQIEELERLHKELRGFVAELSGQAQVLPDPLSPSSIPAPKSPIPPSVSKSYQGLDVPPPGEDFIQRPLPTGSSSQNLTTNLKSENSPAPENEAGQVLPSSNLGGFGFGLGSFLGSSPSRSNSIFNTDKLGSYRDILDDLEEMADRAFAISPRLGPLDEVAPETKYTNDDDDDDSDENQNKNENDTQTSEPSADDLTQLTSFVQPIVPADLPDYTASLTEETPFSGISSGTYSSLGEFKTITAFGEEDTEPTFVPPPPPTPPKAMKAASPVPPLTPQVDDILSDLLDESLIRLASQTVSTSLSSQDVSSVDSAETVIPEEDWQENAPEEFNTSAEVLNEELLEENPEEKIQEDEFIDQIVNSFPEDKNEELPSGKPPIQNLGNEPGSTSEDPSSVGFSSLSGGPPPKRRRR